MSMVCMLSKVSESKTNEKCYEQILWLKAGFVLFFWVKSLLIKALLDNLGGPFDLMSRRMVSANNNIIAERIIKEIEIFPVVRDDEPLQKK